MPVKSSREEARYVGFSCCYVVALMLFRVQHASAVPVFGLCGI